MEHVEVDGLRIAFEERGDGPPLVLLHGLPGDSRVWRRQLDDLSDSYRIIAWDAPGCGRSADPAPPYGLEDAAGYLARFVDALQLGHPHVLGLSWGGGLALELYRQAPSLPATLVLAAAYAGWAGSLPTDMIDERLAAYLKAARAPSGEAVRAWGPGFFSDSADAALIEEMVAISADFHPEPLATLAQSFAETDLSGVLPAIDVPTLILQGDADKRSPMFVGEELHARIPGSQLVVLPGVGHISNIEAPEAFNDAVRNFLDSAS